MHSVIYNLRKYKNLNRKDLVELSSISNYRIRELEISTDDITKKEVFALAKALNCSIFDILNLEELDRDILIDLRNRLNNILD